MSAHVYMHECALMCIRICVRVSVYVCVYVHVCVRGYEQIDLNTPFQLTPNL